jgi:ferredoxin-NADP reductase
MMLTNHQLKVISKRALTSDVVLLELQSPQGNPLPSWAPGAHITLHLDDSLSREYSLCGSTDSNATSWTLAVKRCPDSRGGSVYIHDRTEVGATVAVSGPKNHFQLAPAGEYLFIAGGVGITPIIPMIEHAHRLGVTWRCVYLGKTAASMPFRAQLVSEYGDRVQVHASSDSGRLDLAGLLKQLGEDTALYCCGPESLICDLEKLCAEAKIELHVERFTPKVLDSTEHQPFDVEISGTDTVLHVPADRSMLDVLLDADLDVMSSCEEGTCGTCEVRVLCGKPDHRDSLLTAAEQQENTRMMPCVSRARSQKLVIEI